MNLSVLLKTKLFVRAYFFSVLLLVHLPSCKSGRTSHHAIVFDSDGNTTDTGVALDNIIIAPK